MRFLARLLVALLVLAALVGVATLLGLMDTAEAAAGDPLRERQWNLDLVDADAAHATSTGAGAVVAVVDSGVAAGHPDLAGRLVPGRDVVSGDATAQDGNGHGTHVAGIAGAATGNGAGVASVAPGAGIMPVRVLGDDGSGTGAGVAAGIDWARTHGAHVVNLSLGSEVPITGALGSDEIDAAIRRALAAGIVVVAASGNNGVPVCEQPAAAQGLVCVGSVDRRGQRSFFSSFGSGLAVVAPGGSAVPVAGEDVLSTVPPDGYAEIAGTSQAAPHVAGVAALLVALGVRGRAAADRILATATDLGPPGPDAQYGHGLVNARAAVAGLGMAGGAPPGAGGGSRAVRAFVRARRRQGARRAIRLRMRSTADGRARIRVRARQARAPRAERTRAVRTSLAAAPPARRTRIVRTSRALRAGRARTVRVRVRRIAPPYRARVRVKLPGEQRRRVRRVRVR